MNATSWKLPTRQTKEKNGRVEKVSPGYCLPARREVSIPATETRMARPSFKMEASRQLQISRAGGQRFRKGV